MNKYESVFIVNPSVEEDKVKALIQKFSDLINNDGKVLEVDEKGKIKLAYPVKKNSEGYFIILHFESQPSVVTELERVYRITDEVIKFMTTRVNEK